MVRYMFRESLTLAKAKFVASAAAACPKSRHVRAHAVDEVRMVLQSLVEGALAEYGNVGIYDPSELAEVDFLNHPELLVKLVAESTGRASRLAKPGMLLMTEITTQWMQMMVERSFPPLTPHHTQAFTVLMMARFYGDYLGGNAAAFGAERKRVKLPLKAFIAQLATGEGKSIVIAMLAVFMVKLYGLKVHVLENNEGLLERDYATNAPFYARFGLKSGKDLAKSDGVDIVYCLKRAINKHFLRAELRGARSHTLGHTPPLACPLHTPTREVLRPTEPCRRRANDGWQAARGSEQDGTHRG